MESLLTERFRTLGAALGLTSFDTRRDGQITELYLYDRHALQMEIDWRENNLFLYAVRLRERRLPERDIVYRYGDGQLCRTYLEAVYRVKRTEPVDPQRRYSEAYLWECFDFYEGLIMAAPTVLLEFFNDMDERV